MRVSIVFFSVIMLCFSMPLHAEEQVDLFAGPRLMTDTNSSDRSVTASEADSIAFWLLGIPDTQSREKLSLKSSVKLSNVQDSTTAFLSDELNSRQCWKVSIIDLPLNSTGTKFVGEIAKRSFDVFIDQATGIPLKIVSQLDGYDESYWRKLTSEEAEEMLAFYGQKYIGLPTVPPAMSLTDAVTTSTASIFQAGEITALYVNRLSRSAKKAVPVWEIFCYDVSWIYSARHPEVPKYARDRYRLTINSMTGGLIGQTNIQRMNPGFVPPDSAEWNRAFERMSKLYPGKKKE